MPSEQRRGIRKATWTVYKVCFCGLPIPGRAATSLTCLVSVEPVKVPVGRGQGDGQTALLRSRGGDRSRPQQSW